MRFFHWLYKIMNAWVWSDLPSYPDIYINLRKAGYCELDASELAYIEYCHKLEQFSVKTEKIKNKGSQA